MKKKILIINHDQFGYHSDTYYYCKYLREKFKITYICWDYNNKKINLSSINIIYISRKGNIVVRNLRFINYVLKELKNDYHLNFIKYFRGCSLVKLWNPSRRFILDIRTGFISKKILNRWANDSLMKLESMFFKHISVISKSLGKKLNLSKNTYILPLGADIICDIKKTFDSIDLLYVGILSNRNINQTIKGFSNFYHKNKDKISMSYTIIGSGYDNEEDDLKKLIKTEKLSGVATITGQIPHDELINYFERCNIGVSYIPITDYFDVQPATKTYEYLLSGMPVIATATYENSLLINDKNGILIDDTPNGFKEGLKEVCNKLHQFDSAYIAKSSEKYSWENIISELMNYLDELEKAK